MESPSDAPPSTGASRVTAVMTALASLSGAGSLAWAVATVMHPPEASSGSFGINVDGLASFAGIFALATLAGVFFVVGLVSSLVALSSKQYKAPAIHFSAGLAFVLGWIVVYAMA